MEIYKSTLKNIAIIFVMIGLSIGVVVILLNGKDKSSNSGNVNTSVVTIEDGKQIIDITAKAGYKPSLIEAKANMETILRVSTNNTFDCSSALKIPKLNVSKNLPATGKTDIPIAAQEVGAKIDGTCSMGMYNFSIKFI